MEIWCWKVPRLSHVKTTSFWRNSTTRRWFHSKTKLSVMILIKMDHLKLRYPILLQSQEIRPDSLNQLRNLCSNKQLQIHKRISKNRLQAKCIRQYSMYQIRISGKRIRNILNRENESLHMALTWEEEVKHQQIFIEKLLVLMKGKKLYSQNHLK